MRVRGDVYTRSPRVYRDLEKLTYPFHDATFTVTHCGRICFKRRKVNLGHVFCLAELALPRGQHAKLQIVTVGELLDGKRIDMPPIRQTSVTFKRAPKAGRKAAEQRALYGSDDEPV